jgi:hypothetical protein
MFKRKQGRREEKYLGVWRFCGNRSGCVVWYGRKRVRVMGEIVSRNN